MNPDTKERKTMFALDLSRGPLNSSYVPLSACVPWSDGDMKPQNREAQAGISLRQQLESHLPWVPYARTPQNLDVLSPETDLTWYGTLCPGNTWLRYCSVYMQAMVCGVFLMQLQPISAA